MKRLIFAYDGSEDSQIALREIPHLGLPDDLNVMVVCAVDIWMPFSDKLVLEDESSLPESIRRARERARVIIKDHGQLADDAAAELRRSCPSWKVHGVVSCGPPASVILRNAKQWGADLIVMGTHGRGVVGRFIHRSVSRAVINGAECPVSVLQTEGETCGPGSATSGHTGHSSNARKKSVQAF